MKRLRANYYAILIIRIAILYLLYFLCRVLFIVYNYQHFPFLEWSNLPSLLWGGFVFDTSTILITNSLFILLSLLPTRKREKKGYQTALMALFVGLNSIFIIPNIADIFFYNSEQVRITLSTIPEMFSGSFWALLKQLFSDYWIGILIWIGSILFLLGGWLLFRYSPIVNRAQLKNGLFFAIQLALVALVGYIGLWAVQGFERHKPVKLLSYSDAEKFVESREIPLIVNNPLCIVSSTQQGEISLKGEGRALPDEQITPVAEEVDSQQRSTHSIEERVAGER